MAKRVRHKKLSALHDMLEKMQEDDEFKNHKVLINPQGEAKMSEVILELIRPYREMANTLAVYQNLVATACIAWNTANIPEDKWPQIISAAISKLPGMKNDVRKDMMQFILELIRRKVLLFPDNHRMIVNFKVTETKNNYHVAIASTLQPKDADK